MFWSFWYLAFRCVLQLVLLRPQPARPVVPGLVEPLSERELEVLQLLAAGSRPMIPATS